MKKQSSIIKPPLVQEILGQMFVNLQNSGQLDPPMLEILRKLSETGELKKFQLVENTIKSYGVSNEDTGN